MGRASKTLNGQITKINKNGFGFFKGDGGEEVFLPARVLNTLGKDVYEGRAVEVSDIDDQQGEGRKPVAYTIRVLGGASKPKPLAKSKQKRPAPKLTEAPDGTFAGVVKWFNVTKGFGFIEPEEPILELAGRDAFVHVSVVEKAGLDPAMLEDLPVSFELEMGRKGLQVVNLIARTGTVVSLDQRRTGTNG